ncbi:alpha/beta hydrolase [Sphingobacterium sp. UT-1RO-CII-1]|uniref:alpha/beta fold hydrolase n=1 Tax=Sphingobacterium sp. UT-1RO-CII-1 TaxID=2995225 RepID=UPI00227C66F4|nr:alpha/beta hydrolase [Sphingobacterium sp. UT-1RO-CII-1]MCY4778109.1 alpha/beta hydrolase [Sphingobacterium sp. UT-1RO-CII-1]
MNKNITIKNNSTFVSSSSIKYFFFFFLLTNFIASPLFAQNEEQLLKDNFKSALNRYKSFEDEHRRHAKVKNVSLSYLEWGDKRNTKKVLVWLHGSLSNAYEFAPFADEFVAKGYRVISIDQYNTGATPIPNFDASFDDLNDDIKALLDLLRIKKVTMGGFSRGGFLATSFYARYPSYLNALILEDGGSVAFGTSYYKLNRKELQKKLQQVNLPQEIEDKYFGFYNDPFHAYCNLYDFETKGDQFEILSYLRPRENKWITYRGLPEYYHMKDSLQMAEALFGSPKVSDYASSIIKIDPTKVFRNLSIPVLILDANSPTDPTPVLTENKLLAEAHPTLIKLVVFNDVDHNIHYAYPNEFKKEVSAFLDKVYSR